MKNTVLIVCDTLSAFHLPFYGYDRDTAPFLTELAEENVLFNFAYSTAPWTPPAHASIFSGKLPKEHNCTSKNLKFTDTSFVEELQSKGHTTIGLSNNPLITEELGFHRGFETFLQGPQIYSRHKGGPALIETVEKDKKGLYNSQKEKYLDFVKKTILYRDFKSAKAGLDMFVEKLKDELGPDLINDDGARSTLEVANQELEETEPPFFLFMNLMECHSAYVIPGGEHVDRFMENPEDRKKYRDMSTKNLNHEELSEHDVKELRNLYDASIRYLDRYIEKIYNTITDKHPDTEFIILSDHGENLGDYGLWKHGYGVFENLIRVPLIIAGETHSSKEIDKNVSTMELKNYITGKKKLEDLGSEEAYAEYYGTKEEYDKSKYGYNHRKIDLLRNASKAIIEGNKGFIKHSHLKDFSFKAKIEGFDEKPSKIDGKERLEEKVENKFDIETQGIDI